MSLNNSNIYALNNQPFHEPKPLYTRYPKPPYSYAGMVVMAIQLSDEKCQYLCEILETMRGMFPFFRGEYIGWMSSVRHTLSKYDFFVRQSETAKSSIWCVDLDKITTDIFARQVCVKTRRVLYAPQLHLQLNVPRIELPNVNTTSTIIREAFQSVNDDEGNESCTFLNHMTTDFKEETVVFHQPMPLTEENLSLHNQAFVKRESGQSHPQEEEYELIDVVNDDPHVHEQFTAVDSQVAPNCVVLQELPMFPSHDLTFSSISMPCLSPHAEDVSYSSLLGDRSMPDLSLVLRSLESPTDAIINHEKLSTSTPLQQNPATTTEMSPSESDAKMLSIDTRIHELGKNQLVAKIVMPSITAHKDSDFSIEKILKFSDDANNEREGPEDAEVKHIMETNNIRVANPLQSSNRTGSIQSQVPKPSDVLNTTQSTVVYAGQTIEIDAPTRSSSKKSEGKRIFKTALKDRRSSLATINHRSKTNSSKTSSSKKRGKQHKVPQSTIIQLEEYCKTVQLGNGMPVHPSTYIALQQSQQLQNHLRQQNPSQYHQQQQSQLTNQQLQSQLTNQQLQSQLTNQQLQSQLSNQHLPSQLFQQQMLQQDQGFHGYYQQQPTLFEQQQMQQWYLLAQMQQQQFNLYHQNEYGVYDNPYISQGYWNSQSQPWQHQSYPGHTMTPMMNDPAFYQNSHGMHQYPTMSQFFRPMTNQWEPYFGEHLSPLDLSVPTDVSAHTTSTNYMSTTN